MPLEKIITRCVMIISCQGDLKEQVQKLVKFLPPRTDERKTNSVYVLFAICNPWV